MPHRRHSNPDKHQSYYDIKHYPRQSHTHNTVLLTDTSQDQHTSHEKLILHGIRLKPQQNSHREI